MGLREIKKNNTMKLILQTAKDIFSSKDYAQVTIEEIAVAAQVGTGTVYNYFKSKADLFISVILCGESDIKGMKIFSESELNALTPYEAAVKMAEYSFSMIELLPKQLWLQIFRAVFDLNEDRTVISGALFGFDEGILNSCQNAFKYYKSKGRLQASVDEIAATRTLYNILIGELFVFLLSNETDFTKLKEQVLFQVKFVFENIIKE